MTEILVLGAGLNGLTTAMLLAEDGHRVTVLERDDAPPPPRTVLPHWDRPGVSQFQGAHFMQPRWHAEMRTVLPEVLDELVSAGGRPTNTLDLVFPAARCERRPDDGRFDTIAARRPVLESAVAAVAARTPQVTIRRGVRATGLVVVGRRVVGVRADSGGRTFKVMADLVVDCTGRRSPLPSWLADDDLGKPEEERADAGFVYYGRHFHGALPSSEVPLTHRHNSISILTVPCDNGTWAVVFAVSSRDTALRALRDVGPWNALLARYPAAAHWADGDPITAVDVMGGLNDRSRRYVVDGRPVATGVVALGDAAYFTNPALGRGASMGILHAQVLRDVIRETGFDDPEKLVLQFDERGSAVVDPWYRNTTWMNEHRLAEIDADIAGRLYQPADPRWDLARSLYADGLLDPDSARVYLTAAAMLEAGPGDEAVLRRVLSKGTGGPRYPLPGPDRAELLAVLDLAAGQAGNEI
ncbi:FAD-dependent oxidoreductase [Actinoplanes xinjiangensis]|uniref:2-polyprenyl-6-methoxyphenol hydroxylase-like FAD-dependent oxidoreductase n=1 Tax=Actinoplanes xinjiangensis TaxID=512350 RepID=A0A316FF48_9ACTN|nr:FAD-dependent oxidoreductase [Actinoplanes xinjiangensis]PWK46286.1 2-polyprenyl-6-methoxyphenol hydroxylase-like FAD-dependent oxidoreductase [Actinoplanes xinjiangensis]GIF40776.1 hypothetical protein Axi01nite_50870 [Actinoplanes xinjiangensis]